jgi:phage gp37-like protein
MDRLAAFVHWNDRQCYDQAIWVAQSQVIDWEDLENAHETRDSVSSFWAYYCQYFMLNGRRAGRQAITKLGWSRIP